MRLPLPASRTPTGSSREVGLCCFRKVGLLQVEQLRCRSGDGSLPMDQCRLSRGTIS